MPTLRNKDVRGDHYITFVVQTPVSLTKEQKRILEELDETFETRYKAKGNPAEAKPNVSQPTSSETKDEGRGKKGKSSRKKSFVDNIKDIGRDLFE